MKSITLLFAVFASILTALCGSITHPPVTVQVDNWQDNPSVPFTVPAFDESLGKIKEVVIDWHISRQTLAGGLTYNGAQFEVIGATDVKITDSDGKKVLQNSQPFAISTYMPRANFLFGLYADVDVESVLEKKRAKTASDGLFLIELNQTAAFAGVGYINPIAFSSGTITATVTYTYEDAKKKAKKSKD